MLRINGRGGKEPTGVTGLMRQSPPWLKRRQTKIKSNKNKTRNKRREKGKKERKCVGRERERERKDEVDFGDGRREKKRKKRKEGDVRLLGGDRRRRQFCYYEGRQHYV